MRLRRLDLVRYGKFTDACIDFGAAPQRQPDLHIVYGPNEAGKSTAFSAFLDLLFGIDETRKPGYGYLHRPQSLRIGAALDVTGGLREVVRVYRQPLCDRHERPLADGAVVDELSGLTRESYRTMFSLDDDTLEAGGRSIIASDGDLGQLLFSASAGLAGFSRNLSTLRGEAEAFFKTNGRAQQLNEFRKKLKDLKSRKAEVDTLASAYGQLADRREKTRAAYEETLKQRGALRVELDDLKRRLAALPKMTELMATRQAIGSLPEGPTIPAGWEAMLPDLQRADVELQTRLEGIEGELRRLRGDLAVIPDDDGSIELAGAMEQLAQARDRHTGAGRDLPDRRIRLRDTDAEVARLHRLIDAPDGLQASELMLSARVVGRLRELIESRSGIDVSLAAARSEEQKAARRVAELADPVPSDAGPTTDRKRRMAILIAAIAVAEGGDQKQRAQVAEKSRTTHAAPLASRLADLKPWTGDAAELAAMALPAPADVERLKGLIAGAERTSTRHREERHRLTKELLRVNAEATGIARLGGPPDDVAAEAVRRTRTEAWTSHRMDMGVATAVAFEQAMKDDDDVGTRRLAGSGDVVRLRDMQRTSHMLRAELTTMDDDIRADDAEFVALGERWDASLRLASPQLTTLSPAQFEAWVLRRDRAMEAATALRAAEEELRAANEDDQAAQKALCAALRAASRRDVKIGDLASLLVEAKDEVSLLESMLAGEDLRAEARASLDSRTATLQDASDAASGWTEAWTEAKAGTWLAACEPAADVPTIREILRLLDLLGPAIDKRDGFADRISKMENDQAAFRTAIAGIASALGIESSSRQAIAVAEEIDARIQVSRANLAARTSKTRDIAEAQRRRDANIEAVAAHQRRCSEMTDHFGVSTLADVGDAIKIFQQRSALAERSAELERGIIDDLGAPSLEAAIATLASTERTDLERSLSDLEPRYDDQDQTLREAFAAMRAANDALEAVGGDDAPARLEEEKRTVLLEIEDGAMRYLGLRAGILATEGALQRYRERHRSSMMERASAAFETISGGAYTGLAAHMSKDVETLVGKVAGGGSKLSTEMSKGTRFQLYLALRVAGYQEFVQRRPAVPFIADDIMETFDNERSEQAFRLFAKMAEAGQVIYLTHHPHLCEIAARICPGVAVHQIRDTAGLARLAKELRRLSA